MSSVTPVTPASAPVSIQQKFVQAGDILRGRVLERQWEIETVLCAIIARKHHTQIGPPGCGKTFLADEVKRRIDMPADRYFRWLMTRFTTPEEVFGAVSLKELENDRYVRHIEGKLPWAWFAFLDEFFKANSSILNSFLTIMNEGLFFNNGTPVPCHPIILSGSNEFPTEAELAALWDRVTFRHVVSGLQSNTSRKKMLQAKAARLAQQVDIPPSLTWAEVEQAQNEASQITIPDVVFETLIELWNTLRKDGIEPTDRRFNDCIPIIQATAWRSERTVADVDDMRLLRHVLWTHKDHRQIVDKHVLKLANPLDLKAQELIEQIDQFAVEVNDIVTNAEQQARTRKAVEIKGKLSRLDTELKDLETEGNKSSKRSDMIADARMRMANVVQTLLKEVFDMGDE